MKKNNFKLMALVLIIAMMMSSLVGCGSKDDKPKDQETGGTGELIDGKWNHENRGIVTNLMAAASTSDPFAHANVNDRTWIMNAYEALFSYNGITRTVEPRVGKSFEISDDGLTYTIEMFDNVYFQNGKHCTAEDVKRSYEYGKASSYNTKFSGVVDRVEVIDDYNFNIILQKPSSPFLSNSDQIFILDMDEVEEQGDQFGKIANKAGTGAYYIDKYDPSVEIKLTRQDKFHREIEGRPIPSITFKVMTDPSSTLIAFESGDLDFISNMPATSYEDVENSGKFNTVVGQTTQVIHLTLNHRQNNELSNKKVRQAVAYALDYEGMLEIGMEGYGHVSGKLAYAPYTIAGPKEDSGIIYKYDPEKSKELLKEAGYEDGFDFGAITVVAGSSQEKMAQIMQENLADLGIKATLDSMEEVSAISRMIDGNVNSCIISYYMMMDYDYLASIIDVDGNPISIAKIDGAEGFDYNKIYELFREAREHTDEDERRAIYVEMEELFMDAAVMLPLLHTALPYAWNKDLTVNTDKPYTYHYTHFWDAYWN